MPDGFKGLLDWQAALLATSILLGILAASRPRWGTKQETVFTRGRDLVIALDVSRSMLAEDVRPNRLQRAKADTMDLIGELKGDRAALLAFRRRAVLLCPLTTDYSFLQQALEAAGPGSAPRGETDIADAIVKALDAFESRESSHKAIILISDGEDLAGRALEMARTAAERGIPIFTVGLGSLEGARIPDQESGAFATYKGEEVKTSIKHETLRAIADITGGAYIPVGTAAMTKTTLGTLYRKHLRDIAARDLEEALQRRYVERYQLFLFPAVLLLMASCYLSRGRLRTGLPANISTEESAEDMARAGQKGSLRDLNPPKRTLRDVTAVAVILLGGSALAQTNAAMQEQATAGSAIEEQREIPPGREGARIAQGLYSRGRYLEAAKAYIEAAADATSKSQKDFRYNAAASYFEAGEYEKAAQILKSLALAERMDNPRISTGLGSALYRKAEKQTVESAKDAEEKAKALKDAGEAFKQAARSDTDNETAQQNLSAVAEEWEEAQDKARVMKLLEEYGKMSPPEIAAEMLNQQREIVRAVPEAYDKEVPERIKALEDLSKRQRETADLWIPLQSGVQSLMNTDENGKAAPALERGSEEIRNNMIEAADRLRNLDQAGYDSAIKAQQSLYGFWKVIAPYEQILEEDIKRQTNAISLNPARGSVDAGKYRRMAGDQREAIDLTGLFVERFKQSSPEMPPPQPGTEQGGGMTPDKREKILLFATQAQTAQESAEDLIDKQNFNAARPEQQKAYNALKEIRKLLQSGQQNQQKQDQKQNNRDQQQDDRQKPQEQEQPPPEPEEPRQEPEQEQKQQEPRPAERQEEKMPEDVEELLEKALQREKEHEAEKRRRMNNMPMAPIGRDW